MPEEKSRILRANQKVHENRVNGQLAVSRALGDYAFKKAPGLVWKEQAVTAFPETTVYHFRPKDMMYMCASDGVWDVMTNDQVAAFLVFEYNQGCKRLDMLADRLVRECYRLGSQDNMSVMIVMLDK